MAYRVFDGYYSDDDIPQPDATGGDRIPLFASVKGVAHFTAEVSYRVAERLGMSSDDAFKYAVLVGVVSSNLWNELSDEAQATAPAGSTFSIFDGDNTEGLTDDEWGEEDDNLAEIFNSLRPVA